MVMFSKLREVNVIGSICVVALLVFQIWVNRLEYGGDLFASLGQFIMNILVLSSVSFAFGLLHSKTVLQKEVKWMIVFQILSFVIFLLVGGGDGLGIVLVSVLISSWLGLGIAKFLRFFVNYLDSKM